MICFDLDEQAYTYTVMEEKYRKVEESASVMLFRQKLYTNTDNN